MTPAWQPHRKHPLMRRMQDRRHRIAQWLFRERRSDHEVRTLATLFLLCLIGWASFGVVWMALQPEPERKADPFAWVDTFMQAQGNAQFEFAKMRFGMTPSEVRNALPELSIDPNDPSSLAGAATTEDGTYAVWFAELNGVRQAYRMQFMNTIRTFSEKQVVDVLVHRFGAPSAAECDRSRTAGTLDCEYRWYPPGQVALSLRTRQKTVDLNGDSLSITMSGIDTYLDGKRLRALEESQELDLDLPLNTASGPAQATPQENALPITAINPDRTTQPSPKKRGTHWLGSENGNSKSKSVPLPLF